jgi:hypothetical protein
LVPFVRIAAHLRHQHARDDRGTRDGPSDGSGDGGASASRPSSRDARYLELVDALVLMLALASVRFDRRASRFGCGSPHRIGSRGLRPREAFGFVASPRRRLLVRLLLGAGLLERLTRGRFGGGLLLLGGFGLRAHTFFLHVRKLLE